MTGLRAPTKEEAKAASIVRNYLADIVADKVREGKVTAGQRIFGTPIREFLEDMESDKSGE